MSQRSAPDRHAVALRVAALVDRTERLLAGELTRAEVRPWAELLWHQHRHATVAGNGCADSLLTCLMHLGPAGADALVRDRDLRDHLDAVRRGEPRCGDELGVLAGTVEQLATRLGREAVRTPIEGLGWFEQLRFASPATGRAFSALSPLSLDRRQVTTIHTTAVADGDHAGVVSDLLDTLALDLDDLTPDVPTRLPRWRLVRQDDNGQVTTMATYTGHAKARAAQAAFEARGHKQLYAVEPADDPAGTD